LRLVAVAAVIFYHYGFWGPTSRGVSEVELPALAPFAQYGFLGVPIFFAISGFVIAYSAEGRTPTGFAIARFSRIYPTFVFCMTVTFLVTLAFGPPRFQVTGMQWLANLAVAAPALGQPYVDTSYWSLVIEIIFYGWVTVLMALGLFPRRLDIIILVWLALTFANELTIDAPIFEKIFIADDSGFFIVGLLIYDYFRGRRDGMLYSLAGLAAGTAIFQGVHKLERLGVHSGSMFDKRVVAAICVIAMAAIFAATRIRRIPLPARLTLAAGGITYPLYLLHMQIGYVLLTATAPARYAGFWSAVIIAATAVLAWATWRLVDRPAHDWTRTILMNCATRLGWPCRAPSSAHADIKSA
jgi:peptidoglycan/LPS O-acetylase OafA/YrhL